MFCLKMLNSSFFLTFLGCFVTKSLSAPSHCEWNNCNSYKAYLPCKVSGTSTNCEAYEKTVINSADKQHILDKINLRRNKVASGGIRSLPSAESMIKLEWDEELAASAQSWVDQCSYEEATTMTCRNEDNTLVGRNVATVYGESPGLMPHVLVDIWYTELLNINSSIISYYRPSSSTSLQHYDYFTQLVWGDTTHVGCGGAKFKTTDVAYRLVCDFAPKGNRFSEAVYISGLPCLKCPKEHSCDLEYRALCQNMNTSNVQKLLKKSKNHTTSFDSVKKYSFKIETRSEDSHPIKTKLLDKEIENNESFDSFDLFSHLFESKNTSQEITSTTKCKDVLAVEEFIRLLKHKLNNEQIIREYLFTTKMVNTDASTTDETLAAIVKQLYSTKVFTATTKTIVDENINSTLLADLVEAVIFRQSVKLSTAEKNKISTVITEVVRPIKIQAELGEVKSNNEFNGHYFFPEIEEDNDSEEEDKSESETTESYYDSTNLPISDIALEIGHLNNDKKTRNFLDEILEEDLLLESVTRETTVSNNIALQELEFFNESFSVTPFLRNFRRIKRKDKYINGGFCKKKKSNSIFINYFELLKKVAVDLKSLKLNERFSCAISNSLSLSCFNVSFMCICVLNSCLYYIN